jgi:hypothetical protein
MLDSRPQQCVVRFLHEVDCLLRTTVLFHQFLITFIGLGEGIR